MPRHDRDGRAPSRHPPFPPVSRPGFVLFELQQHFDLCVTEWSLIPSME